MRAPLLAGAAVVALAVVACGTQSAATSASAPGTSVAATSAPAAPASSAPAALTCGTVLGSGSDTRAVITGLVTDQKSQDASEEQGWVLLVPDQSGNYLTSQGQDLQNAASDFQSASGSGLGSDATSLATDASTFLSDQSGGLLPGWVPEYRAIQHDLEKLAGDCSIVYTVPSGE